MDFKCLIGDGRKFLMLQNLMTNYFHFYGCENF